MQPEISTTTPGPKFLVLPKDAEGRNQVINLDHVINVRIGDKVTDIYLTRQTVKLTDRGGVRDTRIGHTGIRLLDDAAKAVNLFFAGQLPPVVGPNSWTYVLEQGWRAYHEYAAKAQRAKISLVPGKLPETQELPVTPGLPEPPNLAEDETISVPLPPSTTGQRQKLDLNKVHLRLMKKE